MGVNVGFVFLHSPGRRAVEVDIAIFVIEAQFPTLEGALDCGLEEGAEYPVRSRLLEDGMNDECTLLRSVFRETEPPLKGSENGTATTR